MRTHPHYSEKTQLYVEDVADEAAIASLRAAFIRAEAAIKVPFGDTKARPVVNACVTEQCYWAHGGRGEYAKVYGKRILLSPRALKWHFIAHEWSHAEMSTRLSLAAWKRMPQWFDEGLAVVISEAPQHSEQHWRFLNESQQALPSREELYMLRAIAYADVVNPGKKSVTVKHL